MYINFAHDLAQDQLDSIRTYVHEMERINTFRLEELSRTAEIDAKKLKEEERDEYFNNKRGDLNKREKTFSSLLRYSIVISVYSTIEQFLFRIVKPHMVESLGYKGILELNPKIDYELKKLQKFGYKGIMLKKLGMYMNNKMEIQFPFENKEWIFIKDLNILRNNIVHCNGRIYDDRDFEKVKKVIESYSSVTCSSSNELILEQEFILYMINQTEIFLSSLLKSANKRK